MTKQQYFDRVDMLNLQAERILRAFLSSKKHLPMCPKALERLADIATARDSLVRVDGRKFRVVEKETEVEA